MTTKAKRDTWRCIFAVIGAAMAGGLGAAVTGLTISTEFVPDGKVELISVFALFGALAGGFTGWAACEACHLASSSRPDGDLRVGTAPCALITTGTALSAISLGQFYTSLPQSTVPEVVAVSGLIVWAIGAGRQGYVALGEIRRQQEAQRRETRMELEAQIRMELEAQIRQQVEADIRRRLEVGGHRQQQVGQSV